MAYVGMVLVQDYWSFTYDNKVLMKAMTSKASGKLRSTVYYAQNKNALSWEEGAHEMNIGRIFCLSCKDNA